MDLAVLLSLWRVIIWLASITLISTVAVMIWFRIKKHRNVVGFFHPYCNAGGGGERVLWCAVNSMQKRFGDKLHYVIYTGDIDVTRAEIFRKAKECFNIDVIDTNLEFVYLRTRPWLEAYNYPHFTLILQSLAGFIVGAEALIKYCPGVFIDTMGYPFALPLFRCLAGCNVACYVHYPVISRDMINMVESAEVTYNNAAWIARNRILTYTKLMYYRLFAVLYWLSGICSRVVMVNGTINSKVESMLSNKKQVQMLSIGQIRPEKDHRLQICFLAELKKRMLKENSDYKVRLVICGGCRDQEDVQRSKDLQNYAKEMGLTDDDLEWALNIPADKLASLLEDSSNGVKLIYGVLTYRTEVRAIQESLIGIHTMQNEHFGISVVEGIAAGQIMIAHNSDFVDCVFEILRMKPEERDAIRSAARKSVDRFSEANFEKRWNYLVSKLLT